MLAPLTERDCSEIRRFLRCKFTESLNILVRDMGAMIVPSMGLRDGEEKAEDEKEIRRT